MPTSTLERGLKDAHESRCCSALVGKELTLPESPDECGKIHAYRGGLSVRDGEQRGTESHNDRRHEVSYPSKAGKVDELIAQAEHGCM